MWGFQLRDSERENETSVYSVTRHGQVANVIAFGNHLNICGECSAAAGAPAF